MMVLIFLLLLISLILVAFKKRRWALWLLAITLIVAGIWFCHHITSHLNLDL